MHVPELLPTAPRAGRGTGAEPGPEGGRRLEKSAAPDDFASLLDPAAARLGPVGSPATEAPASSPAPVAVDVPTAEGEPGEPDPDGDGTSLVAAPAEAVAAPAPGSVTGAPADAPTPAIVTGEPEVAPGAVPVPDATTAPIRQARGPVVVTEAGDRRLVVRPEPPGDLATPAPAPPEPEEAAAESVEPILQESAAQADRLARSTPPALQPTLPGASEPRATVVPLPVAATEPFVTGAPQGGGWRLSVEPATPPRAAAEAPPTVAPQALASQITLAIGQAKDRSVEIRLDPPELGRLQIHLAPTDGGLQALVLAERPETHDLLRRHAELLARELGAAGFRDVQLDFAAGGQAAPGRDEARFVSRADAAPAAAPEPTPTPPPRRLVAGGLDIRL
jgi:hypothetical protein